MSSVMGKAKRDGRWWYYLDDGLYGSYSGQLFDHAKYPVTALRQEAELFRASCRVRPVTRLTSLTRTSCCLSCRWVI